MGQRHEGKGLHEQAKEAGRESYQGIYLMLGKTGAVLQRRKVKPNEPGKSKCGRAYR